MRTVPLAMFFFLLTLLFAQGAVGFQVSHSVRGGQTTLLQPSDSVVIDVFLDADLHLSSFSVAVLVDDAVLTYDAPGSATLPASGSAGPGAQPSYILYVGGKGGGGPLYPPTSVPQPWPTPPLGLEQVNVSFSDPFSQGVIGSGTGIWVASLLFQIDADFTSSNVTLSLSEGGNHFETQQGIDLPVDVSASVVLTPAISLIGVPTCSCAVMTCIHPVCEFGAELTCDDTFDNDGDGGGDCLDADCDGIGICEFATELACDDTFDNDGDGGGDCLDADCDSIGTCEFGVELTCSDGTDNDADAVADCLDTDCDGVSGCELGAELTCDDGIDNDGDGLADCSDSECLGPAGCEVEFQWVDVGEFGNPDDAAPPGSGSVSYAYQIGTFEVTNREYAAFLNSVAVTDPNTLYDPEMSIDSLNGGIERSGLAGSFSYKVKPGFDLRPINYVSYWDALRFVNWLSNGQPAGAQDPATTEDGTYTLSLPPQLIVRNAGSRIFLPSEDEWYKAAYYAGSSVYFNYPTSTEGKPACNAPTLSAPTANCMFGAHQTTNAGSYPSTQNPNGTFDQAGNVWEWLDSVRAPGNRQRMGGSYNEPADSFFAHALPSDIDPTTHSTDMGFRISRVGPATVIPTTSPIAIASLVALLVLAGAAYSARLVRNRRQSVRR